MGVGVGYQREAIQGGQPPVHGRVGRESRLHSMDMAGQVAKAFPDGVKAGKGAEHGEMRGPDMGGDKLGLRAGSQSQLQEIAAGKPQDRPSV